MPWTFGGAKRFSHRHQPLQWCSRIGRHLEAAVHQREEAPPWLDSPASAAPQRPVGAQITLKHNPGHQLAFQHCSLRWCPFSPISGEHHFPQRGRRWRRSGGLCCVLSAPSPSHAALDAFQYQHHALVLLNAPGWLWPAHSEGSPGWSRLLPGPKGSFQTLPSAATERRQKPVEL